MYRFTNFPHWTIQVFSLMCLFQVKIWFDEIIESFQVTSNSFLWKGERFSILPNRSFIVDESLKVYGMSYNQALN